MSLDGIINRSGIWTVFRPVDDLPNADTSVEPAIAAKHLVKFDERDQPVYITRFYTRNGQLVSGAFARRFTNWYPVEPTDVVTALGNLDDRERIISRQSEMADKKAELNVNQGSEWYLYPKLLNIWRSRSPRPNSNQQPLFDLGAVLMPGQPKLGLDS